MSPIEDYNSRYGNIIQTLLSKHGFKSTGRNQDRIYIVHPEVDEKKKPKSGSFHFRTKRLFLFDSPTILEAKKAYSPFDLFVIFEMKGNPSIDQDKKEAVKRLAEMGFGNE